MEWGFIAVEWGFIAVEWGFIARMPGNYYTRGAVHLTLSSQGRHTSCPGHNQAAPHYRGPVASRPMQTLLRRR
jgi:hypothetical protein